MTAKYLQGCSTISQEDNNVITRLYQLHGSLLSQGSITQLYIWHSIVGLYAFMHIKGVVWPIFNCMCTSLQNTHQIHIKYCMFLGFTVITNHMVYSCTKTTRDMEFYDASRMLYAQLYGNKQLLWEISNFTVIIEHHLSNEKQYFRNFKFHGEK